MGRDVTKLPDHVPFIETKRSTKLEDRDFSLYVDGVRVVAKSTVARHSDGITLEITFTTSLGALDGDPNINPAEEIAWGGWNPGDACNLRQPSKTRYPSNGSVQILRVRRPQKAGEEAMFEVRAMSPIYDYEADAEICGASEYALIPASWCTR